MKKTFLIFLFALFCVGACFAQQPSSNDVKRFNITQDTKVPFRLFPTSNNSIFLKLDTRTGQIWGVQYSTESSYAKWIQQAFSWAIDDSPLIVSNNENIGRFTIYPTSNYFNFILLDQYTGETWQVQYSLKSHTEEFRIKIR